MTSSMFPDYVTIHPEDNPDVVIPRSSRFSWYPNTRHLAPGPKATPELFLALAQTGAIDDVESVSIHEWAKNMLDFPALPKHVQSSLRSVHIDLAKFDGWKAVYALPHLETLHVDNKVQTLPEGIGQLRSLRTLTIQGRRIKELPSDLDQLTNLRELEIATCSIKELPERLGTLPLVRLKLAWINALKTLPDSLGQCATLRVLETQHTSFRRLPETLYTLKNLEVLTVEAGKISTLGPHIDLPSLRRLTLEGRFKTWPKYVDMPALEELYIHAPKLTSLPNLFYNNLQRIHVHAPLQYIDPRLANVPHTPGKKQVKLTCTQDAFSALDPSDQDKFRHRLRVFT